MKNTPSQNQTQNPQHRLDVLRRQDGVEVYQAKAPEEGQKFKGLGAEEVLVYQAIDASGDVGIWTRDLRARTNLQQPAVTRILKALEARHLVQAVRSVANGNRKVYMRAGLEPAREVTGGAWYTGAEFDAAFAAGLQRAAGRIVAMHAGGGGISVRGVAAEVAKLGLARVALREEDIATVLAALAADGVVEAVPGSAGTPGGPRYREDRAAARGVAGPRPSALADGLPCGVCPVAGECADGGAVSPATCVYFSRWLAW
jgi:DNA-directed RNA polymerase III subunit RPC6